MIVHKLECRDLDREVDGLLDAHLQVAGPERSFRGLEWVYLH
jgi:hypothetical protein